MARKVAFQGVEGAYSELAAAKLVAGGYRPMACREFADVFRAVAGGKAGLGVIPIENSLTGSIHENFDLLLKYKLWITGETKLRVQHALIAKKTSTMKDLTKVYSHPQALWQCQGFLSSLPNVELTPHFDTAGAARLIKSDPYRGIAAVASREAAKRYGLKILRSGIEDHHRNYTRFLLIARRPLGVRGKDLKTSIVFALKSVPGALHHCLGAFAVQGVQLVKLESRPITGRPWEYMFYLDFKGHARDAVSIRALTALKGPAKQIKVLGSYPAG